MPSMRASLRQHGTTGIIFTSPMGELLAFTTHNCTTARAAAWERTVCTHTWPRIVVHGRTHEQTNAPTRREARRCILGSCFEFQTLSIFQIGSAQRDPIRRPLPSSHRFALAHSPRSARRLPYGARVQLASACLSASCQEIPKCLLYTTSTNER